MSVKVLFVCLGNICRSPTAQGVFGALVSERGLSHCIGIDSAGTSDWHIGHEPDPRSVAIARARGFDLSSLKASQVCAADFERFDYILAMDEQNLEDLKLIAPADYGGTLELLLAFDHKSDYREVPDPYYGGEAGFALAVDLIESASEGLLDQIQERL